MLNKQNYYFSTGLLTIVTFLLIHFYYIGGIGSFFIAIFSMDDTEYSKKYSYLAWEKIEIGMHKDEIIKRIGIPLLIWKNSGRNGKGDIFNYSKSPGDTHYHLRQLEFTSSILVKKIGYYYSD